MQPALFVPHGAPDLALSDIPAALFLRSFFDARAKPRGVVVISAHWQSRGLRLTTASTLDTIHDFGGFGSALHTLRYPATNTPSLVAAVREALEASDLIVRDDPRRGLDHGAWIPLRLMLPEAEVPITQLSLPVAASPQDLFRIGQALASLASQDILVIGSGATVHNLRQIAPEGTPPPQWATGFDDWVEQILAQRDWSSLVAFQATDLGHISHPTPEHFQPLIIIAGICSAHPAGVMRNLHRSYSYGSIGMAAWEVQDAL
ncbi:class III extradiol ring-cleavage dioxygenase [Roseovarius sp. CAU 1744]|uniref:DODA-type extradiol aromatic ring-opening family dioxygenase n=1 Tax=Roseovarius sp. CAU 1744 TaxID=3140368 RepID=UPI00325AAF38